MKKYFENISVSFKLTFHFLTYKQSEYMLLWSRFPFYCRKIQPVVYYKSCIKQPHMISVFFKPRNIFFMLRPQQTLSTINL